MMGRGVPRNCAARNSWLKRPAMNQGLKQYIPYFKSVQANKKIFKTVFLNSESFHTLTEDSESKSALFPSPVKMFVVVDGFIEIWPTAIRS